MQVMGFSAEEVASYIALVGVLSVIAQVSISYPFIIMVVIIW
jgi:hypothetical protein